MLSSDFFKLVLLWAPSTYEFGFWPRLTAHAIAGKIGSGNINKFATVMGNCGVGPLELARLRGRPDHPAAVVERERQLRPIYPSHCVHGRARTKQQ